MSILARKYEKMMSSGRSESGGNRTISMSKELVENVQKEYDRIRDFLSGKCLPAWYRGTSVFHIEGANRLFNAIRDDAEQSTSHRVHSCLVMIGLDPLISRKQIKLLMRLSRGNDLAFLWFLMELHYKTPEPGYSLNEQLICSAICHLDMIPTLRELDRILPPQTPQKRRKRKPKKDKTDMGPWKITSKCVENVDKNNPYFQRLPRPVHYGKSLWLKEPNFTVTFDAYKQYKDPNYVAINETNRWYATYKFQTGKRIVNRLILSEVDRIFGMEPEQLGEVTGKTNICHYHQLLKEAEEMVKRELRVKARDRCMRHFLDVGAEKREERQARMIKWLDEQIDKEMENFYRDAGMLKESLALKAITSDCKVVNFMLGGESCEQCKSEGLKDDVRVVTIPDNSKVIVSRQKLVKGTLDEPADSAAASAAASSKRVSRRLTRGRSRSWPRPRPRPRSQSIAESQQGEERTSSVTFFRNAGAHQPHFFDYEKIFDFRKTRDLEEEVKETIIDNVMPDKAELHLFEKMRISYKKLVYEAVNRLWEEGVARVNEETRQRELEAQREQEEKVRTGKDRPLKDYPDGVYYNPDDKELMERMLQDAFEHIRKSPRFVWAQLPDAHKVPLLQEWIANRYGKQYTMAQRNRSFGFSLKIFQALDRIDISLPIPTTTILGKNFFLDYSCREYLQEKVKKVKDDYNRELNHNIMEHSRIFWFAMKGFLCSGGPPYKTFFAYIPSRMRDIQRFRVWQPFEYRDYKAAWEKRRTQKAEEAK